jgi:hypothetical protein
VLYQGDTRELPEYQSQPDIPTYVQQTTNVPETEENTKMKSFWDVFLLMTNFNLLNDRKMVIICLVSNAFLIDYYLSLFFCVKANVCSMIGYYTPYLFIVKAATDERGILEMKAVYLLSIIGKWND